MKVHEYNEMMAYMLRPRQKFAIGGGVIEGEDLGTRKGFAEARIDDPSQGVKAGDDLGTGIRQITQYSTPRYTASQIGEDISKLRKTLEEAKKDRKFLVDKYKEKVFTYTGKLNYDELIKDPDFEKYWKDRVDGNPIPEVQGSQSKKNLDDAVKKVIDKYKLKKNDYREIYNAILTEVKRSEQIRKNVKSVAGQKPLISPATLSNLVQTFNNAYKPNLGKISSAQMEELLKLPKGELAKLMSKIDRPLPEESMRFVKTSDVSRINKAAVLKDKLDAAGITYSKFQRKPGVKSGREYKFVLDPDRKKAAEKFEILKNSKDFGFPQTPKTPGKRLRVTLSSLSKASEEYKKYGYGRDSGAINNLKDALNRHLTSLNDKELIKFIKKHPKIENLVTVRFNPNLSDMFKNVKLEDMSIEDIRNKANFEIEHIRGFETVKYDEATKKILDGIGVEYPKNLYILNKAINGSVKKQVENYVANFPEETEKIKKINNYFNKNKITYFNRRTNEYGGYKLTNSAVDLSHFGITKANQLKDLITGTYIDEQGIERVKTSDPNKLIATINEVQESRGMPKLKGKFAIPLAFLFGGGYFGTGLIKEISEGRNPFSMSVQAAETGQMPQGSPAQINPVDEGFTTTEKLLAGTTAGAAYAARKPILKTLGAIARPVGKVLGAPSVAAGFSLSSIFDYEKPEDASMLDRLNPMNYKIQDDPDLKMAGADLLLPELLKTAAPRGSGILSILGRAAMNPFGRAARFFTPAGAVIGTAGIAKDYYDFARDEIEKVRAMSPEERQAYNESLMDEGGMIDISREGFDEGGPSDPSKRKFMKIMGGLASLPVVGKFFRVAEQTPVVQNIFTEIQKLKNSETLMPDWFPTFLNKFRKEGTAENIFKKKKVEVSKAEYDKAFAEGKGQDYYTDVARTQEYKANNPDHMDYYKYENTDELIGTTYTNEKVPGVKVDDFDGEVSVNWENNYSQPVSIEYVKPGMEGSDLGRLDKYEAGIADKQLKPEGEFAAVDQEVYATDPDGGFEATPTVVQSLDDMMEGTTRVMEEYATGKPVRTLSKGEGKVIEAEVRAGQMAEDTGGDYEGDVIDLIDDRVGSDFD